MCGICGKISLDPERPVEPELVRRMTDLLQHRGPDGTGTYFAGPVGLGHTRLSIIDLSTGDQPIPNEDRTVWIVFNGEIYNFPELRRLLQQRGHVFRSTSDTEVIVHAYEEFGVDCVSRLRGMFAFAIWDDRRQRLFCARDRLGIKPFYYCATPAGVVFASELKAVLADPSVPREIEPQTIHDFLSFSYVPGERTLFRSIQKLPPGHTLVVEDGRVIQRAYWDLHFPSQPEPRSFEDASAVVRELVRSTVRDHMISDVPVGVLLSGGIDSTVVLSCAAQETGKRIQTFTVGFEGAEFADERPFARMAAERYGADCHTITISAEQFSEFLPRYMWHMEEPIYEPPAVALHYVSELARRHVKVVLSGEGGDEAFGGYHNYRNLLFVERAKRLLGSAGSAAASAVLRSVARLGGLPRVAKYAPLLNLGLRDHYFSRRATPFSHFARIRPALYTDDLLARSRAAAPAELIGQLFSRVESAHPLSQMLYVDTKTWLPDDLLVKADKMTMANSLELRVPLLDHVLLEFAAQLPADHKVRGMETKRILKHAFADAIPEPILRRKKVGFPVPIAQWMRRDLREFVREHLLTERAHARGYFRRPAVEQLVQETFATGRRTSELFSLLALEIWHRVFVDQPSVAPRAQSPAAVSVAAA